MRVRWRPVLPRRRDNRRAAGPGGTAKDLDIIGIRANNLFSAEDTATGLRQAGTANQITTFGFDAGPNQVEAPKEGAGQGLVAQQPGYVGACGLDLAVSQLDGGTVAPKNPTRFSVIPQASVDSSDAVCRSSR